MRKNRADPGKIVSQDHARHKAVRPGTIAENAVLAAAIRFFQAGRLSEAEEQCQILLAAFPVHPDALNIQGAVARQMGRNDLALRFADRAILAKNDFPAFHNNRGTILADLGRQDEAVIAYKRALEIDPDFLDAHYNLGNSLLSGHRLQEAHAAYRQAMVRQPSHVTACNNYGSVLVELEKFDEAARAYRRAVLLMPGYVDAHNNLGMAETRRGSFNSACAHLKRAILIAPADPLAHYNLALALNEMGLIGPAMRQCKRAIGIDPNRADAFALLGIMQKNLGRIDSARTNLQQAIDLAPGQAIHHYNLAEIARIEEGSPQLAALEALSRNLPSMDDAAKIHLHFALGKAYADIRQQDRSFDHLLAGNRLKRRHINYEEEAAADLFRRIEKVFTKDLLQSRRNAGAPSEIPLFILGMPRSGTSLIEQILASHPAVYGAGELDELSRIILERDESDRMGFPEAVPTLGREDFLRLGNAYLSGIRSKAPSALRITDKMPANFRFIGLIHLILPGARIIHATRDPIDTCLSCFSKLFAANHPYSYDLRELGRYWRGYDRLMAHWRKILPPGVMLDVAYEDLVNDLEGQARRLIAHCGLEWTDACLAFHQTDRAVRTASAVQVRQPIYKSSIGRWRPDSELLRPLLEALAENP